MSKDKLRIKELEAQVAILTQQVAYLKRQLFGSKSERFEHPELFEETEGKPVDSEAEECGPQKEGDAPKEGKPKKPRATRKERLPDNLPEIIEEIVPEEVQKDPENWRRIGQEESTQLEKEPGYFYLRRTVRPKYVRLDNPFKAPVIAAAPQKLIEGGFWGGGLTAEILTNRYLDHLPYYRQESRYLRRYGVHLSRKTMSDCAGKVAGELQVLVGAMKRHMLCGGYIRADETFIRYLDRDSPKGSETGYFWAYRGLGGDVIFDWQQSREHRHAADWLGSGYEGVLQSDGYEAYSSYCRRQRAQGKEIEHAACLAHIRRKFEAAREERPELVRWILRIMGLLYALEKPLRKYKADAATRVRVRQNRSRRLIALLGKAFQRMLTMRILPKSLFGKALQYAMAQWPAMGVYLENGEVDIDNNLLEGDIRPSAVGKKNWLFVGSPEAGDRSAILYSLLISARNHGVDPHAYLKAVIEELPKRRRKKGEANGSDIDKYEDIQDLLPANWAAANRHRYPVATPPSRAA